MKNLIFLIFLSSTLFAQFKNVRVNNPQTTDANEVTIAIDPNNPNILAAGSNLDYFYRSFDGGETWSQASMTSNLGVWGDPCVVYDVNSNLYFGHLSNPSTGYWIDRIVVQKRVKDSNQWSSGVGIGFKNPRNQDKEWLAVDHTNSQFRNNIYVTWTEFDQYGSSSSSCKTRILFSKSIDEGENWSDPILVSDEEGNCIDSDETVEGAVPTVGPNGEIYTSWAGPKGILFDKSLDGGKTFGTDILVNDMPTGWDMAVSGINRANGMPITACDISKSAYRGNIYICWADQRNGSSDTDIFFSRSEDGGNTWTNELRINDDEAGNQQFFPWMTVDSTNGNIYAVFYDRRNLVGNKTNVYLAKSVDGGKSFTNFKISTSTFTPSSNVFFGDYICIAAYKGIIHPIWMRLDNGVMSVMTATINDADLIVSADNEIPNDQNYFLGQNYPNPFNGQTIINYNLPRTEKISLDLFSIMGEKILQLESGVKSKGYHEISINADELSSGVYFYTLRTSTFISHKKLILLK